MVEEEHDPAGQDLGTIETAVQRRRHDRRAAGKRLDDQQLRVARSAATEGIVVRVSGIPRGSDFQFHAAPAGGRQLRHAIGEFTAVRLAGKDAEASRDRLFIDLHGARFVAPPDSPGGRGSLHELRRIDPAERAAIGQPRGPLGCNAIRCCPLTSMAKGTSTESVAPCGSRSSVLTALPLTVIASRHGAAAARSFASHVVAASTAGPGHSFRSPAEARALAQNRFDQCLGLRRRRIEA